MGCPRIVSSSCFLKDTRRVTHIYSQVRQSLGSDREKKKSTQKVEDPLLFEIWIFRNDDRRSLSFCHLSFDHCLFFFELWLLITPSVPSNVSYNCYVWNLNNEQINHLLRQNKTRCFRAPPSQ